MCLTNSVSGLSWLAFHMPFLSCLLPQRSLAGEIIRVGSHVLGFVRREGLQFWGRRLSLPQLCEQPVCARHVWRPKEGCLDTLTHTALVTHVGSQLSFIFREKFFSVGKGGEARSINIWSRIVRSVQQSN